MWRHVIQKAVIGGNGHKNDYLTPDCYGVKLCFLPGKPDRQRNGFGLGGIWKNRAQSQGSHPKKVCCWNSTEHKNAHQYSQKWRHRLTFGWLDSKEMVFKYVSRVSEWENSHSSLESVQRLLCVLWVEEPDLHEKAEHLSHLETRNLIVKLLLKLQLKSDKLAPKHDLFLEYSY